MKEKFDDIIKNKIENFINTNEVPYNPEHWKMLQNKKKSSKKRGIVYWRWAAVMMLFLLAGSVAKMLYKSEKPQLLPVEQRIIVDSEGKDTLQEKIIIKNEKQITIVEEIKNTTKQINELKSKNLSKNKIATHKINDKPFEKINKIKNIQNTQKENVIAKSNHKENRYKNTIKKQIQQKFIKSDSLIAQKPSQKIDLKQELKEEKSLLKQQKSGKEKRLATLGVNASPMLSYTTNVGNPNLGYSGGISIEIPLTNSFDVQAELVYANHSMDYLNNSSSADMYNSLASRETLTPKVGLSSREATVTMIEIPLSVKYHFKIQKQKWFVSTGFSATSILKEKIESEYSISERMVSRGVLSDISTSKEDVISYEYTNYKKDISTQKTVNNFYPIGALQMSFGSEFRVGKKQSIVIEPYYKYFVRPITTRKTTFSNVGIRLQYRFDFKK